MKIRLLNLLLIGSIVSSVMLSSCEKDDEATPENPDYSQDKGEFKDSRDNKTYEWVKIGNQIWMAENLNYEIGYSWAYENNPAYSDTYGRLYDWNTALTCCPDGWHLPTDAEWAQLENYLKENGYSYDGVIGNSDIAKSLATNSGWSISDEQGAIGNSDFPDFQNKTGFSALPGGFRNEEGNFEGLGNIGFWWSATELYSNSYYADNRNLKYNNAYMWNSYLFYKSNGLSVRCVKD